MAAGKRDEIERRVLALVHNWLDHSEEDYPDGYEIAEFIIVWHVLRPPDPDDQVAPWEGGPLPGWWSTVSTSSTSRSYFTEKALLEAAVAMSQTDRQEALDAEADEDEDEE